MPDTKNIEKAIHDAQQECESLLETLKGYEKTRLRVTQLESFINMGKALLMLNAPDEEESKPTTQLPLLSQKEKPKLDHSKKLSRKGLWKFLQDQEER